MAKTKASHMHPFSKTFEELKRCKERMTGMKVNHLIQDDTVVQNVSKIIAHIDGAIALIPMEHQKTRHELSKEIMQ